MIKLYNDDALNMNDYISNKEIDCVITSPPYNTIRPNCTDRGYDEYKDGMTTEEYVEFTIKIFKNLEKVLKDNGKILYNMSYGVENETNILLHRVLVAIEDNTEFSLVDQITWKKKTATPNNVSQINLTRITENIFVFCKKEHKKDVKTNKKILSYRETGQPIYENIFNYIEAPNNDGSCELNKATFSSDMVTKLLDIYCENGSTVLDMFSGTGTTAYAVAKANANITQERNLKFVGFEISKKQIEYSQERLKQVQTSMF